MWRDMVCLSKPFLNTLSYLCYGSKWSIAMVFMTVYFQDQNQNWSYQHWLFIWILCNCCWDVFAIAINCSKGSLPMDGSNGRFFHVTKGHFVAWYFNIIGFRNVSRFRVFKVENDPSFFKKILSYSIWKLWNLCLCALNLCIIKWKRVICFC